MNPNFQLVKYQDSAVDDLTSGLIFEQPSIKTASALKAPTGAGKTIVMIGTLEELFEENKRRVNDGLHPYITLWVSDSPSLNEQSICKIGDASNKVDSAFDCEIITSDTFRGFVAGKVYFVNYSKLTSKSNLNKSSETRYGKTIFELMAMVAESDKPVFLLIDEAHKGTKQKGAADQSTIGDTKKRQTIIRQIIEALQPEKILGVSATPGDFRDTVEQLGYDRFRDHEISKRHVIESGMIKSHIVNITLPEGAESNDILVKEAARKFGEQVELWEKSPLDKSPILLVQVGNDFEQHAPKILQWLLDTYNFKLGSMANAFGEHKSITVDVQLGDKVSPVQLPYIEANSINSNPNVQVVFFKEALGEGWDCPRAEILLSLRTQGSETRIEQTVGRILRNPFIMHLDYYNEHKGELGKVYVLTAKYDKNVLDRIVEEFAGEVTTSEVGKKETSEYVLNPDVVLFINNEKFETVVSLSSPSTYSEHIHEVAKYASACMTNEERIVFTESLHEDFASRLFKKLIHNFNRERFESLIKTKLVHDEVTLLDGNVNSKGLVETSGYRSAYDINTEYQKWSIWGVPELKDELMPVMVDNYQRVKGHIVNIPIGDKYNKETICQLVMLSFKHVMKSLGVETMQELGKDHGFVAKEKHKADMYRLPERIEVSTPVDKLDRFSLNKAKIHSHYELSDNKLIYQNEQASMSSQKISFDSALESQVLELLLKSDSVTHIWRNDDFGIQYTKHEVDVHVFKPDFLALNANIFCVYEPKTITQDHFFDKLKGAYKWLRKANSNSLRVDVVWFVQMEDKSVIEMSLSKHGDELVRSGEQALKSLIPKLGVRVL